MGNRIMPSDDPYDYDPIPDGMVVCDRCDGRGDIEIGDDCITEEVGCPVCYGEGLITKALWERREERRRELMKAIWGERND